MRGGERHVPHTHTPREREMREREREREERREVYELFGGYGYRGSAEESVHMREVGSLRFFRKKGGCRTG